MARGRGRKPNPRTQAIRPPIIEDTSSDSSSESFTQVTPKTPLDLGELLDHFIPTNPSPSHLVEPSNLEPVIPSDKTVSNGAAFNVGSIAIPSPSKGMEKDGASKSDSPSADMAAKDLGDRLSHDVSQRKGSSKTGFNLQKGIDLSFVEMDTDLVDLEIEDVEDDLHHWDKTLVGCFIGTRVNLPKIHEFISKNWNHVSKPRVLHLKKNWFYFLFDSNDDRDVILRGGPWFLDDCSLVLKQWHPRIFNEIDELTVVPIWVTFPFLDPMLWTKRALSKIASKIGNPLFADPITSTKERISFARVMIEVDIAKPLRTSIDIKSPFGGIHSQKVSYEWVPYFCSLCKKMGHDSDHCKAITKVFVPKQSGFSKPVDNLVPAVGDLSTVCEPQREMTSCSVLEPHVEQNISEQAAPLQLLVENQPSTSLGVSLQSRNSSAQVCPPPNVSRSSDQIQQVVITEWASTSSFLSHHSSNSLENVTYPVTPLRNSFAPLDSDMMEGGRAPQGML